MSVCVVCGRAVVGRKVDRHGQCDPTSLAGKVCVCRVGCTDKTWGDAGICDPNCDPCRIMRGQTYKAL